MHGGTLLSRYGGWVANRAQTAVGILVAGVLAIGLVAAISRSDDAEVTADADLTSAQAPTSSSTTERPSTTTTTSRRATTTTTSRTSTTATAAGAGSGSGSGSGSGATAPPPSVAGSQVDSDPALAFTGSSSATIASFGSLAVAAGMLLVVVASHVGAVPVPVPGAPLTRRERRLAKRRFPFHLLP